MRTKLIKLGSLVFLLGLTLMACGGDMESIHEEYLQGEKIYAGKLDSLRTEIGYKRIKIIGDTRFLGNSKEVTVQWEDQSRVFKIEGDLKEEFEIIVDGLAEHSYEFKVFTKDPLGNKSVDQIIKGSTVGDLFRSSQIPRRLTGFDVAEETYANWASKAESEFVIFTQIAYDNNAGGVTKDTVYPDDSSILLTDWKPLGKFEIISAVSSGLMGFDTIYLDKIEKTLPEPPYDQLESSYFSMVGMPSDNPGTSYGGNPKQYLFDGDGSWSGSDSHGYHSGENAIPHHFTVDLGVTTRVRKARLDLRDPNNYAGNNPTHVEIWGIDDITGAETASSDAAEFEAKGWQLLHSTPVDGQNQQSVEFNIPFGPMVRYIRYRVTSTVGGSGAQLTELTFWGQDTQALELDKSSIIMVGMPSDNPGTSYGGNPVQYLFDGDESWSGSDSQGYHSGENSIPHHFTLDLGVTAEIRKCRLGLRDPNNYAGNNPTMVELWGINDISGAETASSDAAEFEAKGWQLMYRGAIDGENNQIVEFDVASGPSFRYVRYRVTGTVAGSGAQLTEMTFFGVGIKPLP